MKLTDTNCEECGKEIQVIDVYEEDNICIECYEKGSREEREVDIRLEDNYHETKARFAKRK